MLLAVSLWPFAFCSWFLREGYAGLGDFCVAKITGANAEPEAARPEGARPNGNENENSVLYTIFIHRIMFKLFFPCVDDEGLLY